MTDIVRESLVALTASLPAVTVTTADGPAWGTDLVCLLDIDRRAISTSSDAQAVNQDSLHRLMTSRVLGTDEDQPECFDIIGDLSKPTTQSSLPALESKCQSVIASDERVETVEVSIQSLEGGKTLNITVKGELKNGDAFGFVGKLGKDITSVDFLNG